MEKVWHLHSIDVLSHTCNCNTKSSQNYTFLAIKNSMLDLPSIVSLTSPFHTQLSLLTSHTFLPSRLPAIPSPLAPQSFPSLTHIPLSFLMLHTPPPSFSLSYSSHLTSVCSRHTGEPLNSQSDTKACSLGHIM